MAIGSLQELIVDSGWNTTNGYAGETTWGSLNADADAFWYKLMVLEDGMGLDIANATLQSEYKAGTLDPAAIRRIGMDVAGPVNVHLHPVFSRLVLDMCMWRASTTKEAYSYSMFYNTSLEGSERETRKLLGSKVNTFTISASNDAQELLVSMEMVGKSCAYTVDDWTRDQWAPSNPYLFVDGDVFLRIYNPDDTWSATPGETSPFSPWSPFSPVGDNFAYATISGFSIEGNNNLFIGPKKRDGYIQSLRAGRLALNGSFSLEYDTSKFDYQLLEQFNSGEMILNFLAPGETGYACTTTNMTHGANSVYTTTAAHAANFFKGDVLIIVGTIEGDTISEVRVVKTNGVAGTGEIDCYTYGDGVDRRYCQFKQSPGFRHNWPHASNVKVYNNALRIWIPNFKISDAGKPGAPQEVQQRTVTFAVSKPDISDGTVTSSGFEQISWQAPGQDNTDVDAYDIAGASVAGKTW